MDSNQVKDSSKNLGDIASIMNLKLHAGTLYVPVLKSLELEATTDEPQSIFIAKGGGFTEQLVADGPLREGETVEDRIEKVIVNIKQFMASNQMVDPEKHVFFYKDFQNENGFSFKVYVQDMIFSRDDEQKIIRMLSGFFSSNDKFNDFYQLSLSVGPFSYPTTMLKPGIVDPDDAVTKQVITGLETIMSAIKHKHSEKNTEL